MNDKSVLSYEQKLLTRYLQTTDMVVARAMYIVGILWDEGATDEMLHYIAETQETDPLKLYSKALEISHKYKREESEKV